jgi:ubiquinone/menaquinone biosynthesis C-methylase UbiE
MATSSLNFGGKISMNYEYYLGAFLFEPFAVDLAARLNFTGVSRVLELAAGTGRLTKHIAEALPETVQFVATDLNQDMLDIAKAKVPSARVVWMPADMLNLPFEENSFDLVVCQFGIMLVPDQLKALAEIFRILTPRGKVVFNTWTDLDYNVVWATGDKILASYFGEKRIGVNPGPFALADQWLVQEMLRRAGFSYSHATTVECTGEIESAEKAAYGYIHGLPVGSFIQNNAPELRAEIQKSLEDKLRADLGEFPLKAPQKALIFEAIK